MSRYRLAEPVAETAPHDVIQGTKEPQVPRAMGRQCGAAPALATQRRRGMGLSSMASHRRRRF
jgi:hypothetical protein